MYKNTKQTGMSFWKKLVLLPLLILATLLVVGGIGFSSKRVADAEGEVQITLDANGGYVHTPQKMYNPYVEENNKAIVTHISSTEEFLAFRDRVNVDKQTYEGQIVVLDADVEFSGNPIGYWSQNDGNGTFKGIFDGQGHTVTVTGMDFIGNNNGLFGWIQGSNKGTGIYNLKVHYNMRTVWGQTTGESFGGLVGHAQGYDNALITIQNCSVSADVSDSLPSGADNKFPDDSKYSIYVLGEKSGGENKEKDGIFVGGLVGWSDYTDFISTRNLANISFDYYKGKNDNYKQTRVNVGGIAGFLMGNNKILNCYNIGNLSCSNKSSGNYGKVGGLVGYFYNENEGNLKIQSSYNSSNIFIYTNANLNNLTRAGGLIASVNGGSVLDIKDCFATGSVRRYHGPLTNIGKIYKDEDGEMYNHCQEYDSNKTTFLNCERSNNMASWENLDTNIWDTTSSTLKCFNETPYAFQTNLESIEKTNYTFGSNTFKLENYVSRSGYSFAGWTNEIGLQVMINASKEFAETNTYEVNSNGYDFLTGYGTEIFSSTSDFYIEGMNKQVGFMRNVINDFATAEKAKGSPLTDEERNKIVAERVSKTVQDDNKELSNAVAMQKSNLSKVGDIWNGHRITSVYGIRQKPNAKASSNHKCIDLAYNNNERFIAFASGTVAKIGRDPAGYGNYIDIKSADGTIHRYAHANSFAVTQGQTIKAGDFIGRAGSTGNSTGPHLHYEKIINGQSVDPLKKNSSTKLVSNQIVMKDANGNRALVQVDDNGKPIKVIKEL